MKPAERAAEILRILKKTYPKADCALEHGDPLQLLVATILSAQCTDKRVNMVTPTLFRRYPTAKALSSASQSELESLVRTTGFYRQKAKSIRETCRAIMERHNGRVPDTMEELTALRGVARKTANVVLGTAYGKAEGVVVDTHVKRIAKKLGLTRQSDPVKVERDLMKVLPRKDWIWFSHALITHGRQTCKALAPNCAACPLNQICPSSEV